MTTLVPRDSALISARSFLFAPGDRLDVVAKALGSQADAVIIDLEDAVAAERKERASAEVISIFAELRAAQPAALMRINNPATEQGREDLRVAEALAVAAIVLPKATSAAVELIDSTLPIVALIETAAGLRQAYTIASHPHVLALMLGSVDLALDLGLAGDRCNEALTYAEASLVFDARAANLGAPIHGVCTSISDDGLLRSEAARAKRIGFGAKACIHPVQLPIVHAAFAPDERELAWARRIVQACEAAASRGEGVFRIDGEMVDSPVIERAKRLLAQCG